MSCRPMIRNIRLHYAPLETWMPHISNNRIYWGWGGEVPRKTKLSGLGGVRERLQEMWWSWPALQTNGISIEFFYASIVWVCVRNCLQTVTSVKGGGTTNVINVHHHHTQVHAPSAYSFQGRASTSGEEFDQPPSKTGSKK